MARKIKPPDALPSKAWLMSFGDTMTTLLAFFIVLCSMAEDQTGANLHTGTGSFVQSLKSGGVPGSFSGNRSKRTTQLQATSPLYMAAAESQDDLVNGGSGPDDNPNELASKDREQEEFTRMLNEIERLAEVESLATSVGETTFDFFEKLGNEPPYLPDQFDKIQAKITPLLRRNTHRVELIVWAGTPSAAARARESKRAGAIVAYLVQQAGIETTEATRRILGISRTWPYKDLKRPKLSIVIHRINP